MTMQAIEELKSDWTRFKEANDARLAEMAKSGEATGLTLSSVEAANKAITDKLEALQPKVEDLENRLERARMGGGGASDRISDEQRIRYANWQTGIEVAAGKRKADDPLDPADVDFEYVGNYKKAFRNYLRTGIRNEMLVGDDANGGYWADADMTGRTVEFIRESSPVRQLASVQTITGDALEGELALGEAGDGWVGETETRSETTTPEIAEWRIPLREQYAMPQTTQRILDFADRDVGAWLEQQVRRKFARSEATGFVSGNTPKRPRGFMTYSAGTPGATVATWPFIQQVVSGEAYVAGSAGLTADGMIDLVYALKSDYLPEAVMGMNRTTEAEVRKLKDGNGAYIWQPNFTDRNQARVLGLPVVDLADMANIGTDALPIVVANFAEAYQVVDSPIGIRVLRDNVTTKGKVKFYTTRYVGGDVVNFEAIVIQKIAAS